MIVVEPIESRLRAKIDELRFEVSCRDVRIEDLQARLAAENPILPQGRCGFCGERCHGPACVLHRDMLEAAAQEGVGS